MKEIVDIFLPMQDNANSVGGEVDWLIYVIHAFMLILFLGWLTYYIVAIYKHRRVESPKASYKGIKNKKVSSALETGVALIEIIILVGIALPGWALMASGERFTDEQKEQAIEIQANAQQYAWNFRYAGDDKAFGQQKTGLVTSDNPWGYDPEDPAAKDDFVNAGQMVVPINRPIMVHCRSMDVIHSFYVGAMRVCQDCIPGISIPTYFIPDKIGEYTITCAQLCGGSHYAMKGIVKVVSEEDYAEWYESKKPKAWESSEPDPALDEFE